MRGIFILPISAVLGSCTVQAPPPPVPYTDAGLSQLLAGKAAGAPKSCLSNYRTSTLEMVRGSTVVYREGSRIWVNHMQGGCAPAQSFGYTLVTRPFGFSGPCKGDIAYVVAPSGGPIVGSCEYGDFVPFDGPRG